MKFEVMFLKSAGRYVMVSTNGKPLKGRMTNMDMKTLRIDENGKECVIINNEVVYDKRRWEELR